MNKILKIHEYKDENIIKGRRINMEEHFFQTLAPEVVDIDEKDIYMKALDYAIKRDEIKNIAITGIFGAGKSTIWNSYVKKRDLKDIISITLGEYYDEKNMDNKSFDSERTEKQLINQLLSQIKSNKIPLSKYKFKNNRSIFEILIQILMATVLICLIIIWLNKETFIGYIHEIGGLFKMIHPILLWTLLLFIPISFYLYKFYNNNMFKISKISFKGTEADLQDSCQTDESTFDRNMRELVYLLQSSRTKYVVFEDLDRYDNIEIFTKLHELNYLLNMYLKVHLGTSRIIFQKKDTSRPALDNMYTVKFIYMVRDGLFASKSRTKFFDFIIPIVPIINSNNSESHLIKFLQEALHKPTENIISKISLYIDDMRLLKNIANEYMIYEKKISVKKLDLSADKLLALIVLKNIFPREFELLQQDEGYIYRLFLRIKQHKNNLVIEKNKKIENLINELNSFNEKCDKDKYDLMAKMIPTSLRKYQFEFDETWGDFLRRKAKEPDKSFRIGWISQNDIEQSQIFNYNTFLEKFIYSNHQNRLIIEQFSENNEKIITELSQAKAKLENDIRKIDSRAVQVQLQMMNEEDVEKLFYEDNDLITQNHYFSLIRFLVVEGLIDESYFYYRGCFYEGGLGVNDTIFIKNLLEAKNQDIDLNIENPIAVMERLKITDYRKFNILNQNLLTVCVMANKNIEINNILDSVEANDNYPSLINILDKWPVLTIKQFVKLCIKRKSKDVEKILRQTIGDNHEVYMSVLYAVWTCDQVDMEILKLFVQYLENNEEVVELIAPEDCISFIRNIKICSYKFHNLEKCKNIRNIIRQIEASQLYDINVSNVYFITNQMIGIQVGYRTLLSTIFNTQKLSSTWKYIESNFVDFCVEYIDVNKSRKKYKNEENIVTKIINSNIPIEYKKKYIELNKTIVTSLKTIDNITDNISLIEILFGLDTISFEMDNLQIYCSTTEQLGDGFIKYINKHVNMKKNSGILLDNQLKINEKLINSPIISDSVFDIALKNITTPIEILNVEIGAKRIYRLIDKGLIAINEKNINDLIEKKYYKEIKMFITSISGDKQDQFFRILMSLSLENDLIYILINSDLVLEKSIKLISKIKGDILIDNIDNDKIEILSYLINYGLSNENINLICKRFEKFTLKQVFSQYIDENNKLSIVKNENMDNYFINYFLSNSSFSKKTKLDIIVSRIKNNANKNELIDLFGKLDDISELASVWENKHPALDNDYKDIVADAMVEAGIVYKRVDKDYVRIGIKTKSKKF
jgi:hypothetical protein